MDSTAFMNFTFLSEIYSYSIIDWFKLLGAIIAYLLLILRLKDYYQDRIMLEIDIKSAKFSTALLTAYHTGGTRIEFLVDIRNKGKQPTSISKVSFFSDNLDFNDLELCNASSFSQFGGPSPYFKPIRVNTNDRIHRAFVLSKGNWLEGWNELNCTIKFETSHKTITKKITVTKEDSDLNIYQHLAFDSK